MISDDKKELPESEESVSEARRRLLKIGVYSAPVIIGTLLFMKPVGARAVGSCDPNALCVPHTTGPCVPETNPCVPNN
ncbi:hypothetical protein KAI87_12420 [Myxococcota bacterium]|nr:hypothetical protein [Myxococcota bacterium]